MTYNRLNFRTARFLFFDDRTLYFFQEIVNPSGRLVTYAP